MLYEGENAVDDMEQIAADLARQRTDLQIEKERRQQRGENLSEVVTKLAELRSRIEKLRTDSDAEDNAMP